MRQNRQQIRIVKLGGSLFDLPALFPTLVELLAQDFVENRIVPGGGGFANEFRRLDPIHQWTPRTSHQLGLEAMGLAARMIAASHPAFQLVHSLHELVSPGRLPVLDVSRLEELAQGEQEEFPASWDVTSDSIAAWVAHRLAAEQLLLLKSCSLPSPLPTAVEAADAGWVDPCFPQLAAHIKEIRWANLRATPVNPQRWLHDGAPISE